MCYLKIYIKLYLMHKTNHALLERDGEWIEIKRQNSKWLRSQNFVGWRHKSVWFNLLEYLALLALFSFFFFFFCYNRHGRRVNSLCQIMEHLLFFRIINEPPKRLLDHHIFGHTHHWSHRPVVYSSASARRTAPRFGEQFPLDALIIVFQDKHRTTQAFVGPSHFLVTHITGHIDL